MIGSKDSRMCPDGIVSPTASNIQFWKESTASSAARTRRSLLAAWSYKTRTRGSPPPVALTDQEQSMVAVEDTTPSGGIGNSLPPLSGTRNYGMLSRIELHGRRRPPQRACSGAGYALQLLAIAIPDHFQRRGNILRSHKHS